jgi:hypothetical protein
MSKRIESCHFSRFSLGFGRSCSDFFVMAEIGNSEEALALNISDIKKK